MKAQVEACPTVDGAGFGDFNDAGTTDMMLRDTGDALPGSGLAGRFDMVMV